MIGVLVVSHSRKAAEGIGDIAREMGGDARIEAVGGDPDGGIGTSVDDIRDALSRLADGTDGVVVLADLGSAVMNAEIAVEAADEDVECVVVDAPILEGALNAAVAASSPNASLETVERAAAEAAEHATGT
ncbi:dihydroxyacetone kinase phosphoryl donor subunit DhaM [Halosolutus gelatinilyticus]|uniref:dihydroxyacetone kinase phosphoryl donor subunit DhaM n=1 Tax=Halosolutus gelatinilyticus TaxID=2931975 RepID=UPI001FF5446A|nr:dihydroxyacetone kinase phosphoryl donor subunit DhaM [Halosolutus gelatinilyticus]